MALAGAVAVVVGGAAAWAADAALADPATDGERDVVRLVGGGGLVVLVVGSVACASGLVLVGAAAADPAPAPAASGPSTPGGAVQVSSGSR